MSAEDKPLDLKVTLTERGFEIIEFKDLYDKACSLQQSSLALYAVPGTSAVWLGAGSERMHLSVEQVKSLVSRLLRWAETGSFKGSNADDEAEAQRRRDECIGRYGKSSDSDSNLA